MKGTQPASEINEALSGSAKILVCAGDDNMISRHAFIEDLGIALPVSSQEPNKEPINFQYKDMVIEK